MDPQEITVADLTADPHPILARLRAQGEPSFVPALGGWLVTGWQDAVRILRDSEAFTVDDPRFSTARVVGPSMLSLDGAAHDRHRRPFAAPFKPARVDEAVAGAIRTRARRLVAAIAADGRAELRSTVTGPLAVQVVTELLGLDSDQPQQVLGWYRAMVESVSGITAGEAPTRDGEIAFAAIGAAVLDALAQASAHTSMLGRAVAGEPALSPAEVVSNAAVLLFGGIETTDGMIANALLHVLSHPDALRSLRAAPQLLAVAVEESLRLEPAAAVVDRYATRDVQLGTAMIGKGELVIVSIAAANRDPAVFVDPDRFDLTRPELGRQLAFARGPHFCLGADVARQETAAALGAVLELLPDVRLDASRPASVSGLVFRKPAELHVVWDEPPAEG